MLRLAAQASGLLEAMIQDKRAKRLVFLVAFISITGLSLGLFAIKLLVFGIRGPRADSGLKNGTAQWSD